MNSLNWFKEMNRLTPLEVQISKVSRHCLLTQVNRVPSVFQVPCLWTERRWPTSYQPSPLALLWPSTWKLSTSFLWATTTIPATVETSSWGWRLAQGTEKWCLIGCWIRWWTAFTLAAPSRTPDGKCWCFDRCMMKDPVCWNSRPQVSLMLSNFPSAYSVQMSHFCPFSYVIISTMSHCRITLNFVLRYNANHYSLTSLQVDRCCGICITANICKRDCYMLGV